MSLSASSLGTWARITPKDSPKEGRGGRHLMRRGTPFGRISPDMIWFVSFSSFMKKVRDFSGAFWPRVRRLITARAELQVKGELEPRKTTNSERVENLDSHLLLKLSGRSVCPPHG